MFTQFRRIVGALSLAVFVVAILFWVFLTEEVVPPDPEVSELFIHRVGVTIVAVWIAASLAVKVAQIGGEKIWPLNGIAILFWFILMAVVKASPGTGSVIKAPWVVDFFMFAWFVGWEIVDIVDLVIMGIQVLAERGRIVEGG